MTRDEFLRRLGKINVWKRGGTRAPHKPLLLLWAFGRVSVGAERSAHFADEIRAPLTRLLKSFGPPRKSYHPEFPFWYLRNDRLWEVSGREDFDKLPRAPLIGELNKHDARGGLPKPVYELLRADAELVQAAAQQLLDGHFPESMHAAIRHSVGLPHVNPWRGEVVRETPHETTRARRDPAFRRNVLIAYEKRCAVCGDDMRLDDDLVGLEAAHIRWHAAGGPDEVRNGLALCSLHHKAFDRGAIGLEAAEGAFRLLVSRELTGHGPAFSQTLDLRNQPVRPPQKGESPPERAYVEWHRREVFRGSPRD